MIEGLFNHPGVKFWIHGSGEDEAVTIRIRWCQTAAASLAERFQCEPTRGAIHDAIMDGLRDTFEEVRELHYG